MTYKDEIQKREQAKFAEIFDITQGADAWYYTSYEKPVIYLSQSYTPAPLKRSPLTYDKQLKSHRLKMTTKLLPLALRYIANAPAEPVRIKVIRFFIDSPANAKQIFDGEVTSVTFTTGVAEVEAESRSIIFRHKLPTWIYQAYCNNSLYDSECGITPVSQKQETAVTISGSTLTSTLFGTFADHYFTLGHVIPKAFPDRRLITSHVGNVITLQFPFDSRLLDGATVEIYPGCDKKAATCQSKYSNFNNFKGFPYIPTNNPVVWGLDV